MFINHYFTQILVACNSIEEFKMYLKAWAMFPAFTMRELILLRSVRNSFRTLNCHITEENQL